MIASSICVALRQNRSIGGFETASVALATDWRASLRCTADKWPQLKVLAEVCPSTAALQTAEGTRSDTQLWGAHILQCVKASTDVCSSTPCFLQTTDDLEGGTSLTLRGFCSL